MNKVFVLAILFFSVAGSFGQTTPIPPKGRQSSVPAEKVSVYYIPTDLVSRSSAFTVSSKNLVDCNGSQLDALKAANMPSLVNFIELIAGCDRLVNGDKQQSVSSILDRVVDVNTPNWPFAIVIIDDRDGIDDPLKRDLISKGYIAQGKDEIEPRYVPFRNSTVQPIDNGTISTSTNTPENIRNATLNANYAGFFVVGVKYWGEMANTTNGYIDDIAEALRPHSPHYLVPR